MSRARELFIGRELRPELDTHALGATRDDDERASPRRRPVLALATLAAGVVVALAIALAGGLADGDGVRVAARALLAVVFLVAGVAKLADRDGSRRAARDFGVPRALTGAVAIGLPVVELAVAVVLVPGVTAGAAALAALALLAAFMVAIAAAIARGVEPDCHCFGQLHRARADARALARNALLAGLAGAVVAAGPAHAGPSLVGWLADLSAAAALALAGGAALAALMAFLVWLAFELLRQNGRLVARVEALERPAGPADDGVFEWDDGLAPGVQAPGFELRTADGENESLRSLLARGEPLLLVFTEPGCGPCEALLPQLAAWQAAATPAVALVSRGARAAALAAVERHAVRDVLLDRGGEVARAYRAYGTPAGVLVSPQGTVQTPVAAGAARLATLHAHAARHNGRPA